MDKKNSKEGLPPWEWNFSCIDPFETDVCLRYELAREIIDPAEAFLTGADDATFELQPLSEALVGKPELPEQASSVFLRKWRWSGSDEEGKHFYEVFPGLYFRHSDNSIRAYPQDFRTRSWTQIDTTWRKILAATVNGYQTAFRSFGSQDTVAFLKGADVDKLKEIFDPHPRLAAEYETFVGWVDWRQNDATLMEDFRKWVRRNRPAERPSCNELGRQSSLDSLHGLAALRLRHHYNVEDAMKVSRTVLGKPLYRERKSWERARARAIDLFDVTFGLAEGPRSLSKISNRKLKVATGETGQK